MHYSMRWIPLHDEPDLPEAPGGAKWHCCTLPWSVEFNCSVDCHREPEPPGRSYFWLYTGGEDDV